MPEICTTNTILTELISFSGAVLRGTNYPATFCRSAVLAVSYTVLYKTGIAVAAVMEEDVDNGNSNHTIARRAFQLRGLQLAIFNFWLLYFAVIVRILWSLVTHAL